MYPFVRPLYVFFFITIVYAQNKPYLFEVCKTLCSKEYAGRSYTPYPNYYEKGIEKAKQFLIREIQKNGGYDLKEYIKKSKQFSQKVNFELLKSKFKKYKNAISFQANIIYSAYLEINGQVLQLGIDFLPAATSPSIDFTGYLHFYDSIHWINREHNILLQLENKLIHSAATQQENFCVLHLKKNLLNHKEKIFCKLKITSKIENIQTDNIYAFIPGTMYPDSFIVFSAHYDHLGNIDTTIFPGANDNASGVAVLLDLMKYYKQHPLRYSVAFYFFTGEEIGLMGSKYYVEHPLFDLKRIKCLINLDLMGGGSEGIMVVNGKVFEEDFERLKKLNTEKGYHLSIQSRGKAQNSDHYWFTESGVKSFFIYTLGDITAYHDVFDVPGQLKFSHYEKLFDLLNDWLKSI